MLVGLSNPGDLTDISCKELSQQFAAAVDRKMTVQLFRIAVDRMFTDAEPVGNLLATVPAQQLQQDLAKDPPSDPGGMRLRCPCDEPTTPA